MSIEAAEKPEAKLAQERRNYEFGDDPCPWREPIAKLVWGDVLNQKVIPGKP
jgi:hypothetical protein